MTDRLAEIKARLELSASINDRRRPETLYHTVLPPADIAWLIAELEQWRRAEVMIAETLRKHGYDTLSNMLRDTEPHGNG